MYTILVFWFSGILFTLGFNYKMVCPDNISFRHKLDAIADLFFYYLIAWPFFLGSDIRTILEKEN